jgi:hypothetical protein
VGILDGCEVGVLNGCVVGDRVGHRVGVLVGSEVGLTVGLIVGRRVGGLACDKNTDIIITSTRYRILRQLLIKVTSHQYSAQVVNPVSVCF